MRLGYLENEDAERLLRTGGQSTRYGLVGLQTRRVLPGSIERQDQAQSGQEPDAAIPVCTGGSQNLVGDADSDPCESGSVWPEGSASESSVRLANLLVFVSSSRLAVGDL